ncbi:methyltransferase domain-containing protein [Methylomarinum sp. Ch1-1]|uniref:Methyltransferase domain-containing protein n=1 Tax=Methylomarinum roseum TaxID=3067653 RepID=A0AAU7NYI2_9GAMM|nr:methyltransferase domain-containing protein [Methylomarinum sp. Ch1-1]MDP4521827.1 methyltransferase domain-containing protein [Methylomarinum sp. Ch1-1]
MKRIFLFDLYQTPRGKLLQTMEGQYLKRSITVSCKQQLLQIGGLSWEDSFIDCSLYQRYCILDVDALGCEGAQRVQGKAYTLPVQSESIDLIILPHLLEFDEYRFQTMREIERVLKPGGEVIIINFNPLSFSVRYLYLWDVKLANSWRSHFITRGRIRDWLKLMNFEMLNTVEFNLDTFTIRPGKFQFSGRSIFAMAYGVKAVKRRYRLIPVGETGKQRPRFAGVGNGLESNLQRKKKHD